MIDLVRRIFELHRREENLDTLSPAARTLEQKDIIDQLVKIEAEIKVRASTDCRALLGRALVRLELQLADQGDRAEPELVQLQHDIAAFLNSRK